MESVPFRVLASNQQPRYWALNRFRTRHKEALGNLLIQTVAMAAGLGLVKLGSVAIDGSKVKAYASKHKAMSFARLKREDARLKEEIVAYLDACDEQDALEDEAFGPDGDGMSLPEGLRDAQERREKINEALQELEQRAKERAAGEQAKRKEKAARQGKAYRPRKDPEDATPKDQIRSTSPIPRAASCWVGTAASCRGITRSSRWTPRVTWCWPLACRTSRRTRRTCRGSSSRPSPTPARARSVSWPTPATTAKAMSPW